MRKFSFIILMLYFLLTSCEQPFLSDKIADTSSQFVPVTAIYGTKYDDSKYYGYSQLSDNQKEFFDAFEEIFKLETPVGTEIKVSGVDVDERFVASDLFSRTHQSLGYWELQPPEYDYIVRDGVSYSKTVYCSQKWRTKKSEQMMHSNLLKICLMQAKKLK